jgi:hypothetical protein
MVVPWGNLGHFSLQLTGFLFGVIHVLGEQGFKLLGGATMFLGE